MREKLKHTQIAFEDRLVHIALISAALPLLISVVFIFNAELSIYLKILLIFMMSVAVSYGAFAIRQQVIFQLRTSTNLVEAMTSGDYGLRANNKNIDGALSDFNDLLNKLAERLAQQSLITREKQILLTKITDQIDVAVIAVDQNDHLTLMNPAAERLFKRRFEELQGWPVKALGLQEAINQSLDKVVEFEIDDDKRKVYVRTDTYFEMGEQHRLVFITDIQHLLRDEERLAWQRLLRVLSHEINNSLAPIASISETLTQAIKTEDPSEVLSEPTQRNLVEGLSVITERAHSLNHFIQDYQKLTRLPLPTKSLFALRPFVQSIGQLFDKSDFTIPDSNIEVFADAEQLQQVFVNLFKNAQEANFALTANQSCIEVNWLIDADRISIEVSDNGSGINNEDNLFVPFYTTKKHGSGIGLTLSRQIALNHGGDLSLRNKIDRKGAKATLSFPR
jgi:nitrogen fixation/metabolism regulation signal transduction histidine kinase